MLRESLRNSNLKKKRAQYLHFTITNTWMPEWQINIWPHMVTLWHGNAIRLKKSLKLAWYVWTVGKHVVTIMRMQIKLSLKIRWFWWRRWEVKVAPGSDFLTIKLKVFTPENFHYSELIFMITNVIYWCLINNEQLTLKKCFWLN